MTALDTFAPPIQAWFQEKIGTPTEVQERSWPVIARGDHALITAPTGSGKTFAAFLWALDQLLTTQWEPGRLRVLYISPLKALGTDIRRNLLEPLNSLPDLFREFGIEPGEPRVATRTGDTPQSERRAMLRNPPEILITTPESLNILLTSRRGQTLFEGLKTVILDEVHSVADTKRGVHLMTAVERLIAFTGEVQRLALSATVEPQDQIADWIGGFSLESHTGSPRYRPRQVTVIAPSTEKAIELSVEYPGPSPDDEFEGHDLWYELVRRLRNRIERNRSTLIFANSRRMVEKIARLINEQSQGMLAYSHHGSLAREIRSVVEERLKEGSLRALVATSSLELGIDVGAVDEVLLIQSPSSTSTTLQRIGRSGHSVGATSRGVLFPLHPRDLIECSVLARSVLDRKLEPQQPIEGALDVLSQIVVSMTAHETWRIDDLFDELRQSRAYHNLSRRQFDLVIEMLAGRYESTRLRSLRPLVSIDPHDQTIRARRGSERLVYLSGGTIPDRGYYQLRLDGSGAPLGELDEEFVWERSVGDTFSLGIQGWRIQRITHNDVFASPVDHGAAMAPFWRSDERDRSSTLAEAISEFLRLAESRLDSQDFLDELQSRHLLERDAAHALREHLLQQRTASGCLPHRHRVILEQTNPQSGQADHVLYVIHTMWGGRLNRPFAYALSAALAVEHGARPEILHDDDCVIVELPRAISLEDPFALLVGQNLEDLLRQGLEHTGFFGARFREAAGCALLLPRAGPGHRTPLWLHRQRAKELLETVESSGDFPLIVEAWRACLRDEFDLELLNERLQEIQRGEIELHRVRTDRPSPFASSALWKRTNSLMYEDDSSRGSGPSNLRSDLLREISLSSQLRPALPPKLVSEFQSKIQRTVEGYAPRTTRELVDWIRERLFIPIDEWTELLIAFERDRDPSDNSDDFVARRAVSVAFSPEEDPRFVCAIDILLRLSGVIRRDIMSLHLTSPFADESLTQETTELINSIAQETQQQDNEARWLLSEFLAEWLRFYGPIPHDVPVHLLDVEPSEFERATENLVTEEFVVLDQLTAESEHLELCDRENLERLLRLFKAGSRPQWSIQKPDVLPVLFAAMQGLATPSATLEDLQRALELLFGVGGPADIWETEILPARLEPYLPAWLDSLFAETDLQWIGCGPKRITFLPASDREVLGSVLAKDDQLLSNGEIDALIPSGAGRFSLDDLIARSGRSSSELVESLWQTSWTGDITCDNFASIRRGAAAAFKASTISESARSRPSQKGRARFSSWRSSRPFGGSWYRIPSVEGEDEDPLMAEELRRDRVRLLLERYGVVFRELLARELPQLRWQPLFRTLRLMELSGEIVGGRFFDGITGLQFISHAAIRMVRDSVDVDRVWWINAADPASPCGLGLQDLGYELPRRHRSNYLVFHGTTLVLVCERRGSNLTVHVDPDHPHLKEYFTFLKIQLARHVQPRKSIEVCTINDEPAHSSPYLSTLRELFHATRTAQGVRLNRPYGTIG
ncbi:MAG: DEAD/DEAH box helicase [bacterium]|nr:DEAD/DEAH box helicase [bacterium]